MPLDVLWPLLIPLLMILFLGRCTAGIASPVVSPTVIVIILLVAIPLIELSHDPIRKLKKLLAFLGLGLASSFMIAIFILLDAPDSPVAIAIRFGFISTIGFGLGLITRIKNPHPFWLTIVKALTEPWAIGFIFGYLILGLVPWVLFPLIYIAPIIPVTDEAKLFLPIALAIFYFWGGFLVITIPFGLTRALLDLHTLLTSSPFQTTNQVNMAEIFSGSWVVTILFFLVVFSLLGCVYTFFFLTLFQNAMVGG